MATVIQAYRFALDPTAGQRAALQSHCGAQRYAYNWGLARIRANRWRTSQARVVKLHARVASARRDGLHKLTTGLVRTFDVIVLEDLHVSGLMRNRRLARHIAGVGMGELRRQVEYKTAWGGVELVIADHWYPSSKTCSGCGAVKAKLPLRVRVFDCDECGLALDRDLNAARNLAALAGETTGGTSAASCAGTVNTPDGNPCQPHTMWAAGTATGRPALPRCGPTPPPQGDGCSKTVNTLIHTSGNG